jgi:hypothetical protein
VTLFPDQGMGLKWYFRSTGDAYASLVLFSTFRFLSFSGNSYLCFVFFGVMNSLPGKKKRILHDWD